MSVSSFFYQLESNPIIVNPPLPSYVSIPFIALSNLHVYWYYRKHYNEVFASPQSTVLYFGGVSFNHLISKGCLEQPFIIAARILLIVSRWTECVEQYVKFCKEYQDGMQVWKCQRCYHVKPIKYRTLYSFGPYVGIDPISMIWLCYKTRLLCLRLQRIISHALSFLRQAILLSSSLIYFFEAYSLSKETSEEAKNKIFQSLTNVAHELINQDLFKKINESKGLVDFILKNIGAEYNSTELC